MSIESVHLCLFTDFDDLTMDTPEGAFRFEFSKMFGPTMIGKSGHAVQWRPPHRSQFWPALTWWCQQGHRVENGRCVYDVPAPDTYITIDGTNYLTDSPQSREMCRRFSDDEPQVFVTDPWTGKLRPAQKAAQVTA